MSDITFMIDIETTGVNVSECELLQIALLPLKFEEYFKPYCHNIPTFKSKNFSIGPEGFVFTQYYEGPISEFGLKYQKTLYDECKIAYKVDPRDCRQEILSYITLVNGKLPFNISGKNIGVFDLPILSLNGYLFRNDYHYRVEDMSGCFKLAQRVTGKSREELEKIAIDITPIPFKIPGKDHEALSDCYRQAAIYNGLIKLLRDKN